MMKKIYEESGFLLWEEKASPICPWKNRMTHFSRSTSLRMLTEYLFNAGRVKTYYLSDTNGKIVGYCVVQFGAHPRYFFSKKRDIILGPYYIQEDMRGQGLSVILVDWVLRKSSLQYCNAYDYIRNTNIPSIRCSERCGMKRLYTVRISKYFKTLVEDACGDYGVYGRIRE